MEQERKREIDIEEEEENSMHFIHFLRKFMQLNTYFLLSYCLFHVLCPMLVNLQTEKLGHSKYDKQYIDVTESSGTKMSPCPFSILAPPQKKYSLKGFKIK